MPRFYHAKHILLAEKEDVDYIKEQLTKGQSFESLAIEFSECDSAKVGGDLGRFTSGTMDAAFERALYYMDAMEIRFGVKTIYGFHVIKLISKTD